MAKGLGSLIDLNVHMEVLVLTSNRRGFGAYCLPKLSGAKEVDVKMVIYNEGGGKNTSKYVKRKLRKIIKIGPLGAINGVRMRSWFNSGVRKYLNISDIQKIAKEFGVKYETVPDINCSKTVDLFESSSAKLGLSLGNGYIDRSIFEVPKFGMINVHHEELPKFQGAQSVIWQIYENNCNTGYTIHKVNERIDEGEILYSEEVPIEFRGSLEETVSYNYARLYKKSSKGLVEMLGDFDAYWENAKPQLGGQSYTTPSFWQYLKMVYNHRKLARRETGEEA